MFGWGNSMWLVCVWLVVENFSGIVIESSFSSSSRTRKLVIVATTLLLLQGTDLMHQQVSKKVLDYHKSRFYTAPHFFSLSPPSPFAFSSKKFSICIFFPNSLLCLSLSPLYTFVQHLLFRCFGCCFRMDLCVSYIRTILDGLDIIIMVMTMMMIILRR